MLYADALNQIIDDGIEAVRVDYSKPNDNLKRDGAVRGFEECRDLQPTALAGLLEETRRAAQERFQEQGTDYWYWRCRALEVEWVCNVISSILVNERHEPIVPPTVRGVLKAAEIVGVKAPGPSGR